MSYEWKSLKFAELEILMHFPLIPTYKIFHEFGLGPGLCRNWYPQITKTELKVKTLTSIKRKRFKEKLQNFVSFLLCKRTRLKTSTDCEFLLNEFFYIEPQICWFSVGFRDSDCVEIVVTKTTKYRKPKLEKWIYESEVTFFQWEFL